MSDTRSLILNAATQAFAERGFYGASIALITADLPVTKQTLLHHFGSKEKLYGEVLKRISDRLVAELAAARLQASDSTQQIEATFVAFYRSSLSHSADSQLLMRELLDNRRRVETARTWYLKPFLDTLTDMLRSHPAASRLSPGNALAIVYQLLGAITYFSVSEVTLTHMYGAKQFSILRDSYERELRALLAARLSELSR